MCSLRCLKTTLKRVRSFNPIGSNILYTSLWIGQMKDRSLLLNIAIDLEFLVVTSNRNQSLKAEEKQELLKQSLQQ